MCCRKSLNSFTQAKGTYNETGAGIPHGDYNKLFEDINKLIKNVTHMVPFVFCVAFS